MTIVVEGIETFEELAYLQAATRISLGQGYYFSKPLLLEEIRPTSDIAASRPQSRGRERTEGRGTERPARAS